VTTKMKTDAPLSARIAETASRLESVREELRTMPGYRLGSQWHTDRAAEKHRLMLRLECLRRLASLAGP
jgi:hypothetical protein